MFSLSQLKRHLFQIFNLMAKTGIVFEVVYKGVVYDVHVQATKKNPKRNRAKKQRLEKVEVQSLDAQPCPECESLMFAGVCMNRSCPSNL